MEKFCSVLPHQHLNRAPRLTARALLVCALHFPEPAKQDGGETRSPGTQKTEWLRGTDKSGALEEEVEEEEEEERTLRSSLLLAPADVCLSVCLSVFPSLSLSPWLLLSETVWSCWGFFLLFFFSGCCCISLSLSLPLPLSLSLSRSPLEKIPLTVLRHVVEAARSGLPVNSASAVESRLPSAGAVWAEGSTENPAWTSLPPEPGSVAGD